jgi:hypothetical protein
MRRQVGEEVLLRCGGPGRANERGPGLYPKENTLHQQHGESLKTKIGFLAHGTPEHGGRKQCIVFNF